MPEVGISLASCFGTMWGLLQPEWLAVSTGPNIGFGVKESEYEKNRHDLTALRRFTLKAGDGRH